MSLQEVCREIRDRVGEHAGGDECKIFSPSLGKWLELSRTLDFYDIKSGDLLEFKKVFRPLKVKTLDGSVKTVIINESMSISQLVALVCDKLGM